MRVRGEIQCDACSTYCDQDPIAVMGAYSIPEKVVSEKVKAELAWFWLCSDCKEDVTGIEDWFTHEYLTSEPCAECGEPGSYDEDAGKTLCDDCWEG